MNQHDPEFEKTLRAINHYYITQVGICTAALSKLRSAELSDKNIIIRAIMCDMPDCGIFADPAAEDYGVDFWADRAEYVNDTSFNLYVTQAEEKVLWNIGEKGRKPGRLAVPQQRITVRSVEYLVKKYASIIAPKKKITPHKLRSSYGSAVYKETNDIYLVADILGHNDVNITRKFYAAIEEDRRKSVKNLDIL